MARNKSENESGGPGFIIQLPLKILNDKVLHFLFALTCNIGLVFKKLFDEMAVYNN